MICSLSIARTQYADVKKPAQWQVVDKFQTLKKATEVTCKLLKD
jgi:hypothetical protein